jgi:2-amino-4-hydroxy-6-hydroxymethyldihydropteridine diphosphokinase
MTGARVYVALGSNLGDRRAHLALARERLAALPGTILLASSAIEETAPLGGRAQPPYLNQMVVLETTLTPRALLDACQRIEELAGRRRGERWESRTLDLDLVRYDGVRQEEPGLTLPHPALGDRPFWQAELDELARMGW